MQRLFSLTLEMSCNFDRVSGSTSHILLMLTVWEVLYPFEGWWGLEGSIEGDVA